MQVSALSVDLEQANERMAAATTATSLRGVSQSLQESLAVEVAALRRELLQPSDVSLAEFERLRDVVTRCAEESQAAVKRVEAAQVRLGERQARCDGLLYVQ
jgi:hypothetical protein